MDLRLAFFALLLSARHSSNVYWHPIYICLHLGHAESMTIQTVKRRPRGYWTLETFRAELLPIAKQLGYVPGCDELRAMGHNYLASKSPRYGGLAAIMEGTGFYRKDRPERYWTDDRLIAELKAVGRKTRGVMPTCAELKAMGLGGLSAECGRIGYWDLAKRAGLTVRDSKQLRGIGFELELAELLREKGYRVRKERTYGPWDITAEGLRIDCKTSMRVSVKGVPGYAFNLKAVRKPDHCDVFVCKTLPKDGTSSTTYYVPADAVDVDVIFVKVDPSSGHKYDKWREASFVLYDELDRRKRARLSKIRIKKSRK